MAPSVSLALNCSNNSVATDVFFELKMQQEFSFFSTFYEILTQNPCLHSFILFERYGWNRKMFQFECLMNCQCILVLLDSTVSIRTKRKKIEKKKNHRNKKIEVVSRQIRLFKCFCPQCLFEQCNFLCEKFCAVFIIMHLES